MQEPDSPIRAIRILPAREGEYAEMPAAVPTVLREVLAQRGIEQLYVHQAESFEALEQGKNVVVVTPTASGKTLCYNLPVLCRLMADRKRGRCTCSPPKRWPRINCTSSIPLWRRWARRSGPSLTTATRRRMRASRFANAPEWC